MTTHRRSEVDVVRGGVMVLMALDHVRDFLSNAPFDPLDPSQTTAALFFTRWITHFCAPTFICLAGVSARLLRDRGRSRSELSGFLLTRGCWLIVLELTVVRIGWFFYPFVPLFVGQVIWAIGWSMLALAALVWLPTGAIAVIALGMIAGHNLLDALPAPPGEIAAALWAILHTGTPLTIGSTEFMPVYPLIPWPAVMALGYVVGGWIGRGEQARLMRCGLAALAAFVGVRWLGVYGDPRPWAVQPEAVRTLFSFLNVTKYPPSLLYLLMTLGPMFVALALADRVPGRVRGVLSTFGRVPLFYYVVHLYVIHAAAVFGAAIVGITPRDWLVYAAPFRRPGGFGYALPVVFAVWGIVVALLYEPCRWFGALKLRRNDWWLRYL